MPLSTRSRAFWAALAVLSANLPFSPLRFSQYAADLSKAVRYLEREMLDREKLKREFPGGLQTRIVGPNKYVTLGSKTVVVSPMASDQEIATALNLDKIDGVAAKPIEPIKKNLTGASFLANLIREQQAAIKKQLDQAGTEMQSAMSELQGVANEATNQVKAVKAETADLRAALGLNSNGEGQ